MASATMVKCYHDGTTVFATALVDEGGTRGKVEYNATLLFSDVNALPNNAAKKAAIVAALKAVRDAQIAPAPTDISAIASGIITI